MKNSGANREDKGGNSKEDFSLVWHPAGGARQSKSPSPDDNLNREGGSSDVNFQEDEQPGSLRFRVPEAPKRNWGRIFLRISIVFFVFLILIGSLIFALRFNKQFRVSFITTSARIAKYSDESGMPAEVSTVIKKMSSYVIQLGPKKQKALEKSVKLSGCAATIEALLDKKLKTDFGGRDYYKLGTCLLMSDRYELAKEYIKIDPKVSSNLISWNPEQVQLKLVGIEVNRRLDPFSFRSSTANRYCDSWKVDPNCLIRLVEESRQPIRLESEQGFLSLEKKVVKEHRDYVGWLYFAGGLIASKAGDYSKAEIRFGKAMIGARESKDRYLQREIFRSRVKNAWLGGDFVQIDKVWGQIPAEIFNEDNRSFLDVELLRALVAPNADTKNLIAVYLERPESYMRFNDDIYFIKFVFNMGLKNREYERTYGFLKSLESVGNRSFSSGPGSYWLKLAMIRSLYPQGASIKIQEIIRSLDGGIPDTAELEHLVGLIRLKNRVERGALGLAAENFRKAITLGGGDASSFGLIVTLLEMNNPKAADQELKKWQAKSQGLDSGLWIEFARGLISYSSGNVADAQKVWNDQLHRSKNSLFLKVLMHNLRDDPDYMVGRIFEVLSQILPVDSPLGALALFSQKA